MQFTFDDHTLDTERRELLCGGAVIAVQPQEFDLVVYLVQNREHVVSKDDLIALVWQGRIVSDSTLTSRINAARSAIGDSGKDQKLIRTIPRKGVRFVGSVIEELRAPQPAAAPVQDAPSFAIVRTAGDRCAPFHQHERPAGTGILFRRYQ